jgi:pimeloyl-ACP methyl ester carboxylesterase
MIRRASKIFLLLAFMSGGSIFLSCSQDQSEGFCVKVKFDEEIFHSAQSGKLIFLFDQDTASSLSYWVNPFRPHPVFTYDLKHWNPEDTLLIFRFSEEWYKRFSELEGEYAFRVIFDCDTIKRSSLAVKGNGYSDKQKAVFAPGQEKEVTMEINHVFRGWVFQGNENILEERFRSEKLSRFWGYDMFIESAVVLPDDYGINQKEYALVFVFPGFGSHHASVTYGTGQIDRYGMNTVGEDKIFVFLNGEFFQGYHHFADSENNGPWGKAFTEEFLPYLESRYRVAKDPDKRYLMGQSSGAWTAVWLQVNYPDLFGGAFAASPDPLDFRAQAFNIYLPDANFYYPPQPDSAAIEEGNKKKLYAKLEYVLDEFGQVRTWEASYSPRRANGSVDELFDRNTGDIDPEVAAYWEKYDISKIIAADPIKYREKLSGKLHIFVAEDDPYGLERSVQLLESILIDNNIPADIQYFRGLGHNVWTDELRAYIHKQIDRP